MNYTKQQQDQITAFWQLVERKLATDNETEVMVRPYRTIRLKEGGKVVAHTLEFITEIVHVTSSFIDSRMLLLLLKEQPYFIGLMPVCDFNGKRTSAFVFDFEKIRNIYL